MNHCIFVGNLVDDPKLDTVNGKNGEITLAKFAIGVNDRTRDKAVFPRLEAWGKAADMIGQYFRKGDLIRVYCRFDVDTWDDKDTGERRSRPRFVVDRFEFVEGRKRDAMDGVGAPDKEAGADESTTDEPEPMTRTRRGSRPGGGRTARRAEPELVEAALGDDEDEIDF